MSNGGVKHLKSGLCTKHTKLNGNHTKVLKQTFCVIKNMLFYFRSGRNYGLQQDNNALNTQIYHPTVILDNMLIWVSQK